MAPRKPRKPPVKHKAAYVAQVLRECNGITRAAADRLMVTESTVRAFIKNSSACREAREDGISDLLTVAEDNLIEMVMSKDRTATLFVLKTLGKSRWGESQQDSGKEQELEFEVDDGKAGDD